MMELLSLSRLDKEQDEILNAAQRSGNSLLRIVNDILDWSKIEAGKLELAPRVATIDDLIKSVTNTYSQIASEKDIRIQVEIDPELNKVHLFDTLRVAQILNNFTSNALKFTRRGSIKLSASRLARHDDNETVRFSVQDSGVGVSKDHLARLFEQYEQASAETARMYGGTGLGLSICRRLADMMGGTLSVESEVGIGSTFCFTVSLPMVENVAPGELDLATLHGNVPNISPLVNQDQRIVVLIADDHPINRMLLKQQLDKLGVQAVAAADGVEALALWQAKPFDLIITDCHMPVMDGYELSSRIRDLEQLAGTKRIPIIAWTANAMVEEVEHCHAAGMDGLLTKPTELHVLRAKLLKWLVRSGVLPEVQ
jgi:CheY-like chemotaxis protein/two-component sensor histidine kinase